MACPCECCNKTGACCKNGTCSVKTCAACEADGGLFQGWGTECFAGQCPCDPPADHTQCERCDGGGLGFFGDPLGRCQPGEYCCSGVCQPEPCGAGACCGADCGGAYSVDFIPDAPEDFTSFLSGRGYGNVTYMADDPTPGAARWSYDCCLTDPNDTEEFAVSDGTNEQTFSVPLCLSASVDGCSDGLTAEQCADAGGTFAEGWSCSEGPCDQDPTGACCDGSACTEKTESACDADGGVWQGANTDCDPNPCADCDADEDCCVCGALISLGDPCPDGWTREDLPGGEWYCVSPELPMPCGNRTQECEDIRQQLIDATGYDDDYGESAAGYCCDGECSAEECPP